MNVPQHVAIILDGNGRWAKSKGMPRTYGHIQGAKNVEDICEAASDLGIKYLSVYAFSTENWNRPSDEVAALMKLLKKYLSTCIKSAKKNNMRIRIIGDKEGLDEDFQERIRRAEESTKQYTGINFIVALNYGSRDEMLRAMKKLAKEVEEGKRTADSIDEASFEAYLDTADIPAPDLLIRTSGEQRLSNFMLWQLAYTEFYFTPVHWPDFDVEQLKLAIEAYQGRNRRYGKVEE